MNILGGVCRQWLKQVRYDCVMFQRNVHIPRRALLYVPGDDKRKLRKALQVEADCIALDLEDGVAMNKKVQKIRLAA